mmetsp:Transcript_162174/g.520095  ORF Transcript_162174/g.520095 Transcript_162174/m.520095 type:complete len:583 (+) Transcript_162174:78-1826(+)
MAAAAPPASSAGHAAVGATLCEKWLLTCGVLQGEEPGDERREAAELSVQLALLGSAVLRGQILLALAQVLALEDSDGLRGVVEAAFSKVLASMLPGALTAAMGPRFGDAICQAFFGGSQGGDAAVRASVLRSTARVVGAGVLPSAARTAALVEYSLRSLSAQDVDEGDAAGDLVCSLLAADPRSVPKELLLDILGLVATPQAESWPWVLRAVGQVKSLEVCAQAHWMCTEGLPEECQDMLDYQADSGEEGTKEDDGKPWLLANRLWVSTRLALRAPGLLRSQVDMLRSFADGRFGLEVQYLSLRCLSLLTFSVPHAPVPADEVWTWLQNLYSEMSISMHPLERRTVLAAWLLFEASLASARRSPPRPAAPAPRAGAAAAGAAEAVADAAARADGQAFSEVWAGLLGRAPPPSPPVPPPPPTPMKLVLAEVRRVLRRPESLRVCVAVTSAAVEVSLATGDPTFLEEALAWTRPRLQPGGPAAAKGLRLRHGLALWLRGRLAHRIGPLLAGGRRCANWDWLVAFARGAGPRGRLHLGLGRGVIPCVKSGGGSGAQAAAATSRATARGGAAERGPKAWRRRLRFL